MATPVNLFEPKSTSAVAAPNPLKGIFVLSNFALVTLAFLILAVSTASSAKSPTTIVPSIILAEVTASAANIVVTTLPVPIAVTPVLVMVTSPVGVTCVASFVALPTYIFPSVNVVILDVAVST